MPQTSPIPDDLLVDCTAISCRADYTRFEADLRRVVAGADSEAARRSLGSINLQRQAKAFLQVSVQDIRPEASQLERAFLSQDRQLITAAAFCLTCFFDSELFLQRRLLFGPERWEPSDLSDDARFWLISFMGYSGKRSFGEVLMEALLKHPHFCPPGSTSRALEELGFELEPGMTLHSKSIAVDRGSKGQILISEDLRFSGYSTCPQCRFFPCRINHYYSGAIQDCSFWNRTDPDKLGAIRDLRKEG